ncbi:PilZ domain-containing protein [Desulfogranum marinum]|uniref:PilZ domain-containing protein n=1 Tax=Desulfogranum marinum TaxID=453220 RepID=UPI00196368B0|nr:PilZ domain-containing protein [Desulfogranum marinum]MBM9515108.1 PilZ domain-containing protein [Desulfogranum marinum]
MQTKSRIDTSSKSKIMSKIRARADIDKNRLHLNFNGIVTKKKMEELYTDLRFCVPDLSPGFDLVSDYSECKLLQLHSIPTLKKIIGYLIENGLSETVRIIKKDHISYNQILNLNVRVQGYIPIYASSQDEADNKLSTVIKRKGVRIHLHEVPVDYEASSVHAGSGKAIDISISGCAIKVPTEANELNVNDEVDLQLAFGQRAGKSETISVKSRVVRVEKNLFAVEFAELEEAARAELWRHILSEARS